MNEFYHNYRDASINRVHNTVLTLRHLGAKVVLFLNMDTRIVHVTVKIISHTSMSIRDWHFPNADVAEYRRQEFA